MAIRLPGSDLTAKQEKFAQELARTGVAAEAYRRAYNASGMAPSSVHRKASEVASNGKVQARVRHLTEQQEARGHLSADILRQRVIERLDKESTAARSDSARIAATIALGRLDGVRAFEAQRREVTVKRTVDTAQAEQALRLALQRAVEALGLNSSLGQHSQEAIDITPVDSVLPIADQAAVRSLDDEERAEPECEGGPEVGTYLVDI